MARKRRSPADSSDQDLSLAARAAWLSFIGGLTQGVIANRLGLSAAKAHRLIALAQQRGLVKVFVEGVPDDCLALEDRLAAHFGLESCAVAPNVDPAGETRGPFAAVGSAGARFLHRWLEEAGPALIGVGKGRTLSAAVAQVPTLKRPDLKFVSVSGSLTRKLAANPFDVVHALVAKTGGEGYFLPVPYLAGSVEEKEVLLEQKSVRDLLALAREAELYVVGIGAHSADAHVRATGMVSESEWAELTRLGAVGDLMGSFLDCNGKPVDAAANRQAVGLAIADLKGRRVAALAGSAEKGPAILAALATGVITDLVVDESAARRVVEMLDGAQAQPGKEPSHESSLRRVKQTAAE